MLLTYGCDMKTDKISINNNLLKSSLVGSWHLCESTGGGGDTTYNVCPTIVFLEDGNGNMKSSEKKLCDFQYVIKNDLIVFSLKSSNDKDAFFATGTEFKFKFNIQGNIETLELSQVKTNYKFILSRIK